MRNTPGFDPTRRLIGDTAIYNASGLNYLRHTDYLNSSRLATTWGHAVYPKVAYAPFGETYNEAGTPDRSFTGQDQDVVAGSAGSGVYDFLFRKYDPSAGRWLSPDPSGWGAVSLSAPQSLNRYAYVQNNPMQAVDPTGLDCLYLNSNGSVTVGANYDCPTDSNGNPTDNGYFIDATNVVGGTFDSNGNLTAIFSGASVDVNAYGDMGPTLLGVSAGGAVAPNNVPTNPRTTQCKIKVGAGLAIDTAGAVASFLDGAVVAQVAIGVAATAYSAYNQSIPWTLTNATAMQASAVAPAAKYATFAKTAKALERGGQVVSIFALGWDAYHAKDDYNACLAGG